MAIGHRRIGAGLLSGLAVCGLIAVSVGCEPAVVAEEAGASDAAAEAQPAAASWPLAGGTPARNGIPAAGPIRVDFDPTNAEDLLWSVDLGSQSYGNPIVSGGKVLIGSNNGAGYREKYPKKEDYGVLLCFDFATGKFLWQLTREKLAEGEALDWPMTGICSSACVDGDRAYLVTNRCELICVDLEGFIDGENDGPYTTEVDAEAADADIVWILDMKESLGVLPHNLATSNPLVYGDLVFTLTSNGVDEVHESIPAPEAPSFIAVNKLTGEVAWQVTEVSSRVLHGQWASPALGMVDGEAHVYFPGGDGWLYAYVAETGEELWRCDLNPKVSTWDSHGRGDRNTIVSTPIFVNNSVILAVGDDPEFGEGVGHLYRIDATKRGDVSLELGEIGSPGSANPNSAVIWHYGGVDVDGSLTGKEEANIFRRTICAAAVADGLVIIPDFGGRVHCVDLETGKRYWEDDLLSSIWASPLIADGKIFIADESGQLWVRHLSKELKPVRDEILFDSGIYANPALVGEILLISDRSKLYAIKVGD